MPKILELLQGINAQAMAPPEKPKKTADQFDLACEQRSPPETGLPLFPLTPMPAVFVMWEEWAAAQALQQLQDHARDSTSERLAYIAIELAELGLPGRAAHALNERLKTHPGDGRTWGALSNVYLLAGKFDEAIAAAKEGLNNRLEPLVANKVIVKAQLLMGKTLQADTTLRSRKKRSSLVSAMVKHALNSPLSPSVRADPNEIHPAEEIACFFGWRGFPVPVVQWLNGAIARGDFREVARVLRSPFIAPIRDDPELQRTIESLGLDPRQLVAYRVDASSLPGKLRSTFSIAPIERYGGRVVADLPIEPSI